MSTAMEFSVVILATTLTIIHEIAVKLTLFQLTVLSLVCPSQASQASSPLVELSDHFISTQISEL